ncbi:MAG: SLC13 family permease [Rhodocyclaceae bacterium]
MNADGWTVIAILGAAVAAFASNRVRVDAVGMMVLLALAVSGVVTAREAVAGFSDPAVLMIGGLFVVGEALVATGVAAGLGSWLVKVGRGSETRLIVLLMSVVTLVGAFMSSTGIVAIFIPVVLGIVAQTGFRRSRVMMPLAVAALVSGLMTLIATPPNLVASAALVEAGLAPIGFFELTPIGVAVAAVAIFYMVTVGRRLLDRPDPHAESADITMDELAAGYGVTGRVRALRIAPNSPLAGRTVAEADVRSRYGVTLVAVARQRGKAFGILPAMADTLMRSGDVIGVVADGDAINRFALGNDLHEAPLQDRLRSVASQEIGAAEVMLAPDSPLIGKTLREASFRRRRGLTVLAIKRRGQILPGSLIETPLKFGDLILVTGGWPSIAQLQETSGEFVVLRLPQELKTVAPARARAPMALGIVATMVTLMATGLLPNVVATLLAAFAVVATGCLPYKSVYRCVGWPTLLLIAGMLPLATALDKTGVTAGMANSLVEALRDVGPHGMLAVLFLVTAAVSLFVSNTATAVLVAPVAIDAALELGVSPHAFAITVAVACSCAFVTPVSSPVNTLVLDPGRYRFTDFLKVGLPLLALSLIVTVAMVDLIYRVSPA